MQAKDSPFRHLLDAFSTVGLFCRRTHEGKIGMKTWGSITTGLIAVLWLTPATLRADDGPSSSEATSAVVWHHDYHQALDRGSAEGKMLLLWLFDPQGSAEKSRFETDVLSRPSIGSLVANDFVAYRAPANIEITSGGKTIRLLDHPAFAEMQR